MSKVAERSSTHAPSPGQARHTVCSFPCVAIAFWKQQLIVRFRRGLAIAAMARPVIAVPGEPAMNTAAVHHLTWAVAAAVTPRSLRNERDRKVDPEPEVRQRAVLPARRGDLCICMHARHCPGTLMRPQQAHIQIAAHGRRTDC